MTPEECDTLRAAMHGQRALSDLSDKELADSEDFYEDFYLWALTCDELQDLRDKYGEPEVRRMLAEFFEQEVKEYRSRQL